MTNSISARILLHWVQVEKLCVYQSGTRTVPSEPLFSTHIQAMRGVEATPRQLLIAGRQVCSTVQGIHLSDTKPRKHQHKFSCKLFTQHKAAKRGAASLFGHECLRCRKRLTLNVQSFGKH